MTFPQGGIALATLNGTETVVVGTASPQITTATTQQIAALGSAGKQTANTNITTVGNGTLTAAAIDGRLITRSGSVAAFTDTTDTAAAIIAAISNPFVGQSFQLEIINNTLFTQTLANGLNVTLSGISVIPGASWLRVLVTLTSLTAVSMYGIETGGNISSPPAKFTTASLSVGAVPAGAITGADFVVWQNTGTTPGAQTVRTAAQMLADTPGGYIGLATVFRIVNTGSGTLTLTADAGATVTITGHAAVLTNTFVDYVLTFNTATTATIQSIGAGTSP